MPGVPAAALVRIALSVSGCAAATSPKGRDKTGGFAAVP